MLNIRMESFSSQRFLRLRNSFKKYERLIIIVGLTAEPIVLSILANNPRAVYFIYTERSEKYTTSAKIKELKRIRSDIIR